MVMMLRRKSNRHSGSANFHQDQKKTHQSGSNVEVMPTVFLDTVGASRISAGRTNSQPTVLTRSVKTSPRKFEAEKAEM